MPKNLKMLCAILVSGIAMQTIGQASAEEISVMSMSAETGPTAFAGVPLQNGIRLAFEEANKDNSLGDLKVKLITEDYAGDKGQVINLSNRAIQRDNVIMMLGPITSADALAVAPIFNGSQTPFISVASSNAIVETGPWAFKFRQSGAEMVPMVARYALERTPARKVAIIYDRTNDGQIEYRNVFRDAFKAGGGTVATEESVASSDTNFLPLVTKILSMDVDSIFLSTYAEQTANIVLQLRQAGMPKDMRLFGPNSFVSPGFVKIAGKAAEGIIAVTGFVPGDSRLLNKKFEALYKARYNTEADTYAADGYSLGQIALQAIREASPEPTRQKVLDALTKIKDVPVVVGSGTWSLVNRLPQFGAVVVTVKDGQFVPAP